jgi:hypothetical protein
MVNFICQPNWARGCPDSWTLLLGMSVREFHERLGFELASWVKQMVLPKMSSIILLTEDGDKTKNQSQGAFIIPLPAWERTLTSFPQHSWFMALQMWTGICIIGSSTLWPLSYTTGLLAGDKTSQPPKSCELLPYNKYPYTFDRRGWNRVEDVHKYWFLFIWKKLE